MRFTILLIQLVWVGTNGLHLQGEKNVAVGEAFPYLKTDEPTTESKFQQWVTNFKAADSAYQAWCRSKLTGEDVDGGSQFDQDIFLLRNVFASKVLRGEIGTYVDSGANDWKQLSNTLFYDKCLGWKGICIEPQSQYINNLKEKRSCSVFQECITKNETYMEIIGSGVSAGVNAFETQPTTVRCRPLQTFMEDAGIQTVDFWSLDVEGHEMKVLDADIPFDKIGVILMENFWLSTRNSDYLLNSHGFSKLHQMAIDGLFVNHGQKLWYPPKWTNHWQSNQNYRHSVKPQLDPDQ